MNTSLVLMLLALSVGLHGCTRVLPVRHKATVVDYTADRRGAYIFELSDGKYALISEPPPDIAREITSSLGVSAESIGDIAGGDAKLKYAYEVIDLARRSQTLQVLREALFRLAEMGVSSEINSQQRVQLYTTVLDLVRDLGLAELKRADAEAREAAAMEAQSLRQLLESRSWSPEQRDQLMERFFGDDIPIRDMRDPQDIEPGENEDNDAVGNATRSLGPGHIEIPERDLTDDR